MRSEYPAQKVEKKPSKVKAKVTETATSTAKILRNTEQLVVASALLITTVFSYTQLTTVTNQVWYYMILASVIIVGLLAFSQLVKFLNR